MKMLFAVVATLALLAGAARAEITDKSAAGFEVTEKATIATPQAKGGLAETFAAPVDGMLGEQLGRLRKYLETGKPG